MLLTWKPIMAVSIAKAIPSLLEPAGAVDMEANHGCFNRESDSVTVGAHQLAARLRNVRVFQSRKRFRHCWSGNPMGNKRTPVELQSRKRFRHCWSRACPPCRPQTRQFQSRKRFRHCWSLAWNETTLLQRECFNRESDSVTVGAGTPRPDALTAKVSIAKAIPSLLEPMWNGLH